MWYTSVVKSTDLALTYYVTAVKTQSPPGLNFYIYKMGIIIVIYTC